MTADPTYREARVLDWGESEAYDAELAYAREDGWSEVFRVVSSAGTLVVAEVTMRPIGDEVPAGGITTRKLRDVHPAQALVDARRLAGQQDDRHPGLPVSTLPAEASKGVRSHRRHVLEREAALLEEAAALGVRAHAKWIWERLHDEGIYRARATVRNDLHFLRHGARKPAEPVHAFDDVDGAAVLAAGARALEVARWRLDNLRSG